MHIYVLSKFIKNKNIRTSDLLKIRSVYNLKENGKRRARSGVLEVKHDPSTYKQNGEHKDKSTDASLIPPLLHSRNGGFVL